MNYLIKNKRILIVSILAIVVITIGLLSVAFLHTNKPVYADEVEISKQKIRATYSFSRLNDKECSVRIANKAEAEFAKIPSSAIIEGKEYIVTEIAASGFASSPNLAIVILPKSVVKVGNLAFNNCNTLFQVHLANVQEIGTNAFSRCPNLNSIIIPESVSKIGNTIFRTNNTDVYVRASGIGNDWSATWNNSNNSQELEFDYIGEEDVILEPINISTFDYRSTIIGYQVAEGQPFAEAFYADKDIIIPGTKDGLPVLNIDDYAFEECGFDNLIVQYSEYPINLGGGLFTSAVGNNVFINREITFEGSENVDDEGESMCIFADCEINNIILPNNIEVITESMFSNSYIRSIHFNDVDDTITDYIEYISRSFNSLNSEIILPNSIKRIKSSAFNYLVSTDYNKESIDLLYIPNSVEYIYENILAFSKIDTVKIDHTDKRIYDAEYNPTGTIAKDWAKDLDGEVTFLRYIVTLDHQNNTEPTDIEVKLDEEMPIKEKPELRGNAFLGYYSDIDGNGVPFYDSNMNSAHIWDKKEHTTLYANWKLEEYRIIYEVSGYLGEFENLNPQTYTIENVDTIVIQSTEFSINNSNVAFRIEWNMASLDSDSIGEVTVKGNVIAEMSSECTYLHLDSNFRGVTVYLPNELKSECKIVADHGLIALGVVGVENYVYPLSIKVNSTSNSSTVNENARFGLVLSNLRMQAPDDTVAITIPTYYILDLYTYGTVEIFGGNGSWGINEDGKKGQSGIYCGKLNIVTSTNLKIIGGDGAFGHGKHWGLYWNGTQSLSHEVGSSGGAGGSAVTAMKNEVTIYSGNVTIKGGNGGNGVSNGTYSGNGGGKGYAFIGASGSTVTVYINEDFKDTILCENGENGKAGYQGVIPDPINPNPTIPDPIIPPGPIDPIFPPNPPIIIK